MKTGAFTRTATSLVDLTLRDAAGTVYTITGTPEHPFYVPALGDFVPMGELDVGTELRGLNGEGVVVLAVQTRAATVTVYNFEVAETHTYFVAASVGGMAVGVHNADCPGNVWPGDSPTSMPKPQVTDPELQRIVNRAYRSNATVGPNFSTADSIRHTARTKIPVGGGTGDHIRKGIGLRRSLNSWIRSQSNNYYNPPSASDMDIAKRLFEDIVNALNIAGIN